MNGALLRMRHLVREIAAPLPHENHKRAFARTVEVTGLTPRQTKALLYAEDKTRVSANDDRLALLEAAYRRHLEAELARLQGELASTKTKLQLLPSASDAGLSHAVAPVRLHEVVRA